MKVRKVIYVLGLLFSCQIVSAQTDSLNTENVIKLFARDAGQEVVENILMIKKSVVQSELIFIIDGELPTIEKLAHLAESGILTNYTSRIIKEAALISVYTKDPNVKAIIFLEYGK
jgi:hypothetical protein